MGSRHGYDCERYLGFTNCRGGREQAKSQTSRPADRLWSPGRAPTLVKFQRWMKCLATSRAAFPCTTEAMSCQGILGVVCLSMKSAKAETRDGGDAEGGVSEQPPAAAHRQTACPAGSSPCTQSCSSLFRARSECFRRVLPLRRAEPEPSPVLEHRGPASKSKGTQETS